MSDDHEHLIEQTLLLVQRLERISADSTWARRSSGHRGALLRWLERLEKQGQGELSTPSKDEMERFQLLIDTSFGLLEKAAREFMK
jgi:hypothetical protein